MFLHVNYFVKLKYINKNKLLPIHKQKMGSNPINFYFKLVYICLLKAVGNCNSSSLAN